MTHLFLFTGCNPEPWESPDIQITRRNGKLGGMPIRSGRLIAYQEALQEEFRERHPDFKPLEGTLRVDFLFWRELATTRSKPVDATNLLKSTEDALQSLLYGNDRDNRSVHGEIMEQAIDVEPRIVVSVVPYRPLKLDPMIAHLINKEQHNQRTAQDNILKRKDVF